MKGIPLSRQSATDAARRVKEIIAGNTPIPSGPPPGELVTEIDGFDPRDGSPRLVLVLARDDAGDVAGIAHEYANVDTGDPAAMRAMVDLAIEAVARTAIDYVAATLGNVNGAVPA